MRAGLVLSLLVAGSLHFALTSEHMEESAMLGIGFIVAGVAQAALALLLLRALSRTALALVITLNAATVLLYLAHIFIGLPLGGGTLSKEEIAPSGIATKAAELAAIALSLGLIGRRQRERSRSEQRDAA